MGGFFVAIFHLQLQHNDKTASPPKDSKGRSESPLVAPAGAKPCEPPRLARCQICKFPSHPTLLRSATFPATGAPGSRGRLLCVAIPWLPLQPESRLSSNHPYEGLTPTCLYPPGLSFEGAAFSLSHRTAPADSSSRSKAETYAAAVRRLRENAQSTGITSQMKKTIPSNPPHPHKKSKPQNNHGLLQPLLP